MLSGSCDIPQSHVRGNPLLAALAGEGLYKFSDARGLYSGSWIRGKRQGVGEEVTISGRFQVKTECLLHSGIKVAVH